METLFWTMILLSQVFGIASVILISTWLSEYGGGFVWDGSNGVGSYHILFMTIGMVFLYAEGMLSFRVCHRLGLSYMAEKAIHATIQSIVIILMIIGVHSAFLRKDTLGHGTAGKHMFSIHSWLGMMAIVTFLAQWIYGIVMTILLRRLDRSWQDKLLPNHAFFGLLIFALSIGSCLTGLNEMAIFHDMQEYGQIASFGLLANSFGICLVVFASIIAYITWKPDFQIPECSRHPEDNAVPTDENLAEKRESANYGTTEQTSFQVHT